MSKPLGLYKPAEAAAYLGMSTTTLRRHVLDGMIRYILISRRGSKKERRAFDLADLEAFKDAQRQQMTPREVLCRSIGRRGARNMSTTSGAKVVAFTELLAAKGEKL